jgi:hypothetical protein
MGVAIAAIELFVVRAIIAFCALRLHCEAAVPMGTGASQGPAGTAFRNRPAVNSPLQRCAI